MYFTQNEGKWVDAERLIKTLKGKIYQNKWHLIIEKSWIWIS